MGEDRVEVLQCNSEMTLQAEALEALGSSQCKGT